MDEVTPLTIDFLKYQAISGGIFAILSILIIQYMRFKNLKIHEAYLQKTVFEGIQFPVYVVFIGWPFSSLLAAFYETIIIYPFIIWIGFNLIFNSLKSLKPEIRST